MNNSNPTPQKITLEDIARRKQEVLDEIHGQTKAMTATTRRIFAPLAPVASGSSTLMRSFNTGMAIFDGVMLGIKVMRKMRSLFKRSF